MGLSVSTVFRGFLVLVCSVLLSPLFLWQAQASLQIPDCMSKGQVLGVNNDQVLQWKHSSQNGFLARGHVEGTIDRLFNDQTGHTHFEIKIGPNADDTLEVIYNQEFGATPEPRLGMVVEACGDYITSNAPNGGYKPSPSGAIIHWIHRSDNVAKHDTGWLVMDGVPCGLGFEKTGTVQNPAPRPGDQHKPKHHHGHGHQPTFLPDAAFAQ